MIARSLKIERSDYFFKQSDLWKAKQHLAF